MASEIIPQPDYCDCGNPGTIVRVKVDDSKSQTTKIGAFGQFRKPGGKPRELLPRYRWLAWVVECPECFYRQEESYVD